MKNIFLALLFIPISSFGYLTSGGGSSSGNATSLQSNAVSATAPTNNQCLVYTTSNSSWSPGSCSSGSGIGGSWTSNGNVVTTDGTNEAQDSGTALSSVVTLTGSQSLTNKTLSGATWSGTTATGQGNSMILETNGSGNLTAASAITGGQLPTFTGDVTNSSAAMTVAKIAGVAVGTPTGTGNVVFSAAPTLSGNITTGLTAHGVVISNSSNVLSTVAPGATGNVLTSNGTDWTSAAGGGGGGVTTVGSFSVSSIANGASISSTTITFGPADGTNPGMVTTGTQTLAGNKTFSGVTTLGDIAITVSSGAWEATPTTSTGAYEFDVTSSGSSYFYVSINEVQFDGMSALSSLHDATMNVGTRYSASGLNAQNIDEMNGVYAQHLNARQGSTANYGYTFHDDSNTADDYSTYRFYMPSTTSVALQANGVDAVNADSNTNVTIGVSAPATTATNGFAYLPVVSGTPTGTPTSKTGFSPIVFDSGNNKIWVYINGAWKGIAIN